MEVFGYRRLIAYQKAKEIVKRTYKLLKTGRVWMNLLKRMLAYYQDSKALINHQLNKLSTN